MKTYKKFSDFNIFGYNLALYYNWNIKEGTLFGIICTLLYIISFICVTLNYIIGVISIENVTYRWNNLSC